MDKIYFPIEKTVFLPREKAPIGKMERVAARAEVDTIEPAQTGWLCYGKLLIDLEYTPMGAGKGKHGEQWKQVSQQLLAMGKDEKESCTIAVDFIQELPDRDFTYGCEFDADIQKKNWQQIASNAIEIGVDIALSVKEQRKKAKSKNDILAAEENCMVLEQDSFALEEKSHDASRTKKATATEPEELYYYAAEEGCETVNLDRAEDTIAVCPTEEEKPDACNYPVDFLQKEICPTGEGAGSKGQHLCEKNGAKAGGTKVDCADEMVLDGDMALMADCPGATEQKQQKAAKEAVCDIVCDDINGTEEAAPCMSEMKKTVMKQETVLNQEEKAEHTGKKEAQVEVTAAEETCVNEEMVLETEETADLPPVPVEEEETDGCEVVPLPLSDKEKHRFWKGKKDRKDKKGSMEKDADGESALLSPCPVADEKPAEPKKGYRLKFYVVQGGEDLAAIAEKHSVSPGSILAANKNISEEDIRTGMVLSIPM